MLAIGRNFSYFLNLQYESRRLSSYFFKGNIGRTVAQLEDGRTDGRNYLSSVKSYDETRRDRKISSVCSADVELRTDECPPCREVEGPLGFDTVECDPKSQDLSRKYV